YRAFPSEGGHADFAPNTESEAGLLTHLLARHPHVSTERVCSGRGLVTIYDYLRATGAAPESPDLSGRLAAADDRAPIITEAGLRQPPDPLSAAAIAMFVSILGAKAGNLALTVLATGGVYLAGGMPLHLLPALRGEGFMRAFVRKGRLGSLMERMPVHVVVRQAALFGAAIRGLELGVDPERPSSDAPLPGRAPSGKGG